MGSLTVFGIICFGVFVVLVVIDRRKRKPVEPVKTKTVECLRVHDHRFVIRYACFPTPFRYSDEHYQDALDDLPLAVRMNWCSEEEAQEAARDVVRYCCQSNKELV